ncbi:PEP-CTERM sorting domain-containing protein [Stieleria varia]|uniref:Ice-binding protein C-terminal domain-containing protein n=1 Tax=Stieleria varia TaxID=2528005 RepID=A0A5C6B645_9BACT|nr:PEP-CTERM sorting domain-containing protein [Stieleria varia]TWU05974.1 hypothetical protein Pla52n_16900 [Stieleria varia]
MKAFFAIIVVTLLSFFACHRVSADVFFGFSVTGVAPTDTTPLVVNANVGDNVSVDVFYVETGADTFLNDRGLIGFDIAADYDDTFAEVTSATVNPLFNINGAVIAPAGKLVASGNWTDLFGTEGQQVFDGGGNVIFTQGRGRGQSTIQVATLEFNVKGQGITNFDLIDRDLFEENNPAIFPGSAGEVDNVGFGFATGESNLPSVDQVIFGTLAAPRLLRLSINSVTAVPEPTSFALLGLLGTGCLLRRRRSRNTLAAGCA